MSPKVVPGNGAYGNPHPTLYKGNYWDYHFSLLPFFKPFSLLTIPNKHSWQDPIQSSKALSRSLPNWQTYPFLRGIWRC